MTASAVSAIAMVGKCVMRRDVPHRHARILFIYKADAALSALKSFIQVYTMLMHSCVKNKILKMLNVKKQNVNFI